MNRNKKMWLFISTFLLTVQVLVGQSYSPQSGDLSVALRMGRGVSFGDLRYSEINRGVDYADHSYYQGLLPSLEQPSESNFSTQNSMTNIIGVETKFFFTSQLAARFSGAGAIMSTPSSDAVMVTGEAFVEEESAYPGTYLPGWHMMEGRTTQQYYGDLGVDYYFTSNYSRVNPYAGVQFNGCYGQMEIFDGYRGLSEDEEVLPVYDTRRGEAYAFGGSFVGGVDYYLSEGMFLGFEIKTVSYMYNVKRVFHQSGMDAQEAASHKTAFLSQPYLKLGFRF